MTVLAGLLLLAAAPRLVGRARARDATEYFAAGRRAGAWLVGVAGTAAAVSAFTFVGGPGLFAVAGVGSLWIVLSAPLTGALQCWAVGEPVVRVARRHGVPHAPGAARRPLRPAAPAPPARLVVVVGCIASGAVQAKAAAVLGESVPRRPGRPLPRSRRWLATTLYTAAGGMRAGLLADAVQGARDGRRRRCSSPAAALAAAGGPGAAVATLERARPELLGSFGAVPRRARSPGTSCSASAPAPSRTTSRSSSSCARRPSCAGCRRCSPARSPRCSRCGSASAWPAPRSSRAGTVIGGAPRRADPGGDAAARPVGGAARGSRRARGDDVDRRLVPQPRRRRAHTRPAGGARPAARGGSRPRARGDRGRRRSPRSCSASPASGRWRRSASPAGGSSPRRCCRCSSLGLAWPARSPAAAAAAAIARRRRGRPRPRGVARVAAPRRARAWPRRRRRRHRRPGSRARACPGPDAGELGHARGRASGWPQTRRRLAGSPVRRPRRRPADDARRGRARARPVPAARRLRHLAAHQGRGDRRRSSARLFARAATPAALAALPGGARSQR